MRKSECIRLALSQDQRCTQEASKSETLIDIFNRTRNLRAIVQSKSAYLKDLPQKTIPDLRQNKLQVTLSTAKIRPPSISRNRPVSQNPNALAEFTLQAHSPYAFETHQTRSYVRKLRQQEAVAKVKLLSSFFAGNVQQRKVVAINGSQPKL